MADPTNPPAAPAPAAAPSNPNTAPAAAAPGASPPATRDAANAARENKPIQRHNANLTVNAPAAPDADAPAKEPLPPTVPQATLDEMAAGKKALERNKPVATALENARAAKDAGVSTAPETNPVDATHSLQQQGKV